MTIIHGSHALERRGTCVPVHTPSSAAVQLIGRDTRRLQPRPKSLLPYCKEELLRPPDVPATSDQHVSNHATCLRSWPQHYITRTVGVTCKLSSLYRTVTESTSFNRHLQVHQHYRQQLLYKPTTARLFVLPP